MTPKRAPALVVTDLDGTLLDHDSYDWRPAEPALQALRENGVPVVFNTSKTKAETRALQEVTGVSGPFIVENGSCVHLGEDTIVLGCQRSEIQQWIERTALMSRYACVSFAEMGVGGIMDCTGLSEPAATMAGERAWSEPLLWNDSEAALTTFAQEAHDAGFSLLRGGRFVHLIGDCDKGRATLALARRHGALPVQDERPFRVVALGDSANDCAMLCVADRAIWVRQRHAFPPLCNPPVAAAILTEEYGPAGWNASILALIDEGYFDG